MPLRLDGLPRNWQGRADPSAHRLPLFDGPVLASFATKPQHRLFLAELLASYARLAPGRVWQRGEHGWQRQRWDELDLPCLAALRQVLPVDEQPGLWRRIGDGALFLAGVFPGYAERSLGLVEIARLQQATGLRLSTIEGPVDPEGPGRRKRLATALSGLLEELARRAYQRVGTSVPRAVVESPQSARRVLALVADRYLFPLITG